jgi:hypothetical protein
MGRAFRCIRLRMRLITISGFFVIGNDASPNEHALAMGLRLEKPTVSYGNV